MKARLHATAPFIWVLLAAAALLLGGCNSNLVFYEKTAFKLGISAGEDPTAPLEVTGGLKRSVVSRVPPMLDGDTTSAAREAASLLSDFDLAYVDGAGTKTTPGNPFEGQLRIRTVFASGNAARALAAKPSAAVAFLDTDALIDSLTVHFEALAARADKLQVASATAQLMGGAFKAAFDTSLSNHSAEEALQDASEATCGSSMSDQYQGCTNRLVAHLRYAMDAADEGK